MKTRCDAVGMHVALLIVLLAVAGIEVGGTAPPERGSAPSSTPTSRQHTTNLVTPNPFPPFDLRSPVGPIKASRSDYYVSGMPRIIRFRVFVLSSKDGIISQAHRKQSDGIVEFDKLGRVTCKGSWSDGALMMERFEFSSVGLVERSHTYRDSLEMGAGVHYVYRTSIGTISISSISLETGNAVGEEIQRVDEAGRMIEDFIRRNRRWSRYLYAYYPNGSLRMITREVEAPKVLEPSGIRTTDVWTYEYDSRRRVSKMTWTSSSGAHQVHHPFRYTYDTSGNIVRVVYGEGNAAFATTIEYDFDDRGNWVRKVETPDTGIGDGTRTGREVIRSISYWE